MSFKINDLRFPIIAAAIHDGHKIRNDLNDYIFIDDKGRLREEDPYTGKWITISPNNILIEDSRFETDLNRPREKAVYLKPEDSWGLKVWKEELPEKLYKDSLKKYDSFYSELKIFLDKLTETNAHIVIYDLHSYNYKRNGPNEPPEEDSLNPELNLGTGTLNREMWGNVIDRFMEDMKSFNFLGRNLDVRENIKFKGGYFPKWVHQNYPDNVCCLSIEFRKFFMDEWSGKPNEANISEIKKVLSSSTEGVLEELNLLKTVQRENGNK